MTPTEFVLARIADREKTARAAMLSNGYWYRTGVFAGATSVVHDFGPIVVPERRGTMAWDENAHIALNDPAAVLARCAVDRRILEEHETIRARYAGATIEDDPCCKTCSGYGDDPGEYPCATVALLASLDADHPDYDKSWWPL